MNANDSALVIASVVVVGVATYRSIRLHQEHKEKRKTIQRNQEMVIASIHRAADEARAKIHSSFSLDGAEQAVMDFVREAKLYTNTTYNEE